MPCRFFVCLFVAFSFSKEARALRLQKGVSDPVSDLFPKENTVVLVYNNEDENNVDQLLSDMEKDKRVKSLLGYTNTLGKAHNAEDMTEAIQELSEEDNVSENVVRMLYYIKNDGRFPAINVKDFVRFIKNEVRADKTLNSYMDDSLTNRIEEFDKFSDEERLTAPMSIVEMADFLGTDREDVSRLYLYYVMQKGGVDYGTMTLPEFVDFVLKNVAQDETYSEMFDSTALEGLKQLQTFTDKQTVTQARSYKEMASLLGMIRTCKNDLRFLPGAGRELYAGRNDPGQFVSLCRMM